MFTDVPLRSSLAKILKKPSVEGSSHLQAQSNSHAHGWGWCLCVYNVQVLKSILDLGRLDLEKHSKDLGRLELSPTGLCIQKDPVSRDLYSRFILQGRPRKYVWGKWMMEDHGRNGGYKYYLILVSDIYFTKHNIKYTWIIKRFPCTTHLDTYTVNHQEATLGPKLESLQPWLQNTTGCNTGADLPNMPRGKALFRNCGVW